MSQVIKGGKESWDWLRHFKFSTRKYNRLVKPLYLRKVFRMCQSSCNEEQLCYLNDDIEKYGFENGIGAFIMRMTRWRIEQEYDTKRAIEWQIIENEKNADKTKLSNLIDKEIKARAENKIVADDWLIPYDVEEMDDELTGKITKKINMKLKNGELKIFKTLEGRFKEKAIYFNIDSGYVVFITSPRRKELDYKNEYLVLKCRDLSMLDGVVKRELQLEGIAQRGYDLQKNGVKIKTVSSNKRKVNDVSDSINKVKSVMGMDKDANDLLDDDNIF